MARDVQDRMSEGLGEMLERIEERASKVMKELRWMDDQKVESQSEHDHGRLDNERWLSAELDALGEEYDRLEEADDPFGE